jgi:hypothetical protein
MSWGTCYKGSNNIHFDYPALMSDGRLYTNWDPACEKNKNLIKQNGIQTNYQYRQFLINNGNHLMKSNNIAACDQCGVCQYGYPLQQDTNNGKYLYKSVQDTHQPYGYENSDLKNMYVSREQLQSRLSAPIMSQTQSFTMPRAK